MISECLQFCTLEELRRNKDVPISIQSNLASMQAQRQLGAASGKLSATYSRLSSGLRINRASDDAAGLAIATSLNADARVYTQGIRNLNDGVSAMSIAQGALGELREIVTRQIELAEQAANGIYTVKQRAPLNQEAAQLTEEFNRIVRTTEFNNTKLIDNSLTNLNLVGGYGGSGSLSLSIGSQISHAAANGGVQSSAVYGNGVAFNLETADFNRDGIVDVATGSGASVAILLGNGNGSFKAMTTYDNAGSATGIDAGDFNNDGYADVVRTNQSNGQVGILLGNGDGSLKAVVNYNTTLPNSRWVNAADLNQDGSLDLIVENLAGGTTINVLLGNGDGSFGSPIVLTTGTSALENPAVGDINGDGFYDLAVSDYGSNTVSVFFGNGNGTFKSRVAYSSGAQPSGVILEDFNRDGILDMANSNYSGGSWGLRLGNRDGTFGSYSTIGAGGGPSDIQAADLNEDGNLDVLIGENSTLGTRIFFGNGDGTFAAGILNVNTGANEDLAIADINGDGALDYLAANSGVGGITAVVSATTNVSTVSYLDLTTAADARQSLDTAKKRLLRVTGELGAIGSYESRIQSAVNTLQVTRESYLSASSQILDADVASESAELARQRIIQNAAVAVLSQANSEPELALLLLGQGG